MATASASSSYSLVTIATKTLPSSRRRPRPANQIPSPSDLDSDPDPPLPLRYGHKFCPCGRRHLIGSLFPSILNPNPNSNSNLKAEVIRSVSEVGINKFHPQRPDWYQELYAQALDQGMKSYEAQIAGYKKDLFSHLAVAAAGTRSKMNIMELGVGTGPNFKYYATPAADLNVVAVDPNEIMEKYAWASATAAGLPPSNFKFLRGVGEALPLGDNSMDAVIGTLVLCSVQDVDIALKEVRRVLKPGGFYLFIEHVAASDGTFLRLVQSLLDPLQQFISDGCHLTRETGMRISEAGFSSVSLNSTFLSNVSLISPHIFGKACK